MLEHWTALVEEIIDTKLDSAFHNPTESTIVMIDHVVDNERIVKAVCI